MILIQQLIQFDAGIQHFVVGAAFGLPESVKGFPGEGNLCLEFGQLERFLFLAQGVHFIHFPDLFSNNFRYFEKSSILRMDWIWYNIPKLRGRKRTFSQTTDSDWQVGASGLGGFGVFVRYFIK